MNSESSKATYFHIKTDNFIRYKINIHYDVEHKTISSNKTSIAQNNVQVYTV